MVPADLECENDDEPAWARLITPAYGPGMTQAGLPATGRERSQSRLLRQLDD
jgi:hypothetical protein